MFSFLKKNREVKEDNLLGDAVNVMRSSIKVDFDFAKYANRHIFNKLSSNSQYGFYYYPYGYLFRYPKWGVVNELGFRFRENIQDALKKYKDHYKITFYGGSTGFDILVKDSDTICEKLERKLNESKLIQNKLSRPVKIFNLSQPGNLVLNQFINYIIFGQLLRPNMVISHNGVNDLATLQMNDANLVSNYQIGYPDVLEAWGRKIHDAHEIDIDYLHADPKKSDFFPAQARTGPDAVLKAYHTRLHQFGKVCEQAGLPFINGFQPWVTSKAELSKFELSRLYEYNPYYKDVYQHVPDLYKRYRSEYLISSPIGVLADIEKRFGDLDGSVTHFGDVCHLFEAGNEECATVYLRAIEGFFAAQ